MLLRRSTHTRTNTSNRILRHFHIHNKRIPPPPHTTHPPQHTIHRHIHHNLRSNTLTTNHTTRLATRHLAAAPPNNTPNDKKDDGAIEAAPQRYTLKWAWHVTRETALHYYHGSKLLAADTKIAGRMLGRMLRGATLSRREHNLLVRVLSDLLRVVPLSFFVLVPFMEFALPFAIRLFPNLLPSTFEEKHVIQEKRKGLLKVRLSVAQVLEDTLEERAQQLRRERERCSTTAADGDGPEQRDEGAELRKFMKQLRQGSTVASSEEMLRMMSMFRDQLTLDALSRRQLASMCQFMGMQQFGPDALLRFRLGARLRQLRNDDKDILWEGIDSLTDEEVRTAVRARGLPAKGLSLQAMREELQEWLALSQKKDIPSSMLLLANMFRFARVRSPDDASRPAPAGSAAPKAAEPVIDLNAARTAITSISDNAFEDAIASKSDAKSPEEALARLQREQELIEQERQLKRANASEKAEDLAAEAELAEGEHLSRGQLRDIAAAVETMSSKSAVARERERVAALERDREDVRSDVDSSGSRAVKMLDSRVKGMVEALRAEVESADGTIGQAFRSLDLDDDGVLSHEELLTAMGSINEKKRPKAHQFKALLKKLDPDEDGKIQVLELSRLIQEMEMRDDDDERPAERSGKAQLRNGPES